MLGRRRVTAGLIAAGGLAVLAGCAYYRPGGPPPHAPAHGYRRRHRGAELVYDSGLGVYLVAGHPGIYFHDGYYYRVLDGAWRLSVDLGGPWRPTDFRRVPPGLRKKHGAPGRGSRNVPPGQRKKED